MPARIYSDKDADPRALNGRRIAVLGYGAQGRAHALNLRDSGHHVIVAQRPGGKNFNRAVEDGFAPVSVEDAVRQADLLIFALPDEAMGDIYTRSIKPHLRGGRGPGAQALGFIHGFAIRFGLIRPPPDVDVILVAPKGPGTLVRDAYLAGGGLPCMWAVEQDASGDARRIALAWASAIGCGRGGMIESSFAEECEADLFGEQTVLCGGVIELMKAAYDEMVAAGYSPEVAYIECIHEVKQVVDLLYHEGLAGMRGRISNTASYGGLTRGPRLVNDATRTEMRRILEEVRSGRFAAEWMKTCEAGGDGLERLEQAEAEHPSEAAGRVVRELWARAMARRKPESGNGELEGA